MTVTNIKYLTASPYMTAGEMAKQLGVHKNTIYTRIKEIRKEMLSGRYDEFAILDSGGIIFVNYLVFVDYCKWKTRLDDRNLRKTVPPYNPTKVACAIGWYGREYTDEED